MARIWQLGVQEVRPGTYFRTSSGDVTAEGATNGIVALIYHGNWGPLNQVVDISPEDMNNLEEIVGTGTGYNAARQAFIGGAKMIRAVRAGSGGEKAQKTLMSTETQKTITNADGTTTTQTIAPMAAVRIYAKYPGEWRFYITVKTDLVTGKKQILFYRNDKLIECIYYTGSADDATAATKAINSDSKYFTAKRMNSGTKLKVATVTQVKSSVGVNPTYNASLYTAATDVLERYPWNVIITDCYHEKYSNILAAFIRQVYENGHMGMAVVGGRKSIALADRMAYAASINDWRVVYVLNGWVDNNGVVQQSYASAARIAGMIAACETNASITHLVIQDAVKLHETFTNAQMINAEQKGCMILSLNDSEQVWVDNAINTLVTLGNDQDDGWKKIRRTKCRFELMDRINRTCDKLVGRLNNDARGRATILAAMTTVIREMIAERKLVEGSYAMENPAYVSTADKAYFKLVIGDYDSMEKIYLDYVFSYASPFDGSAISA